MNHLALLAVFLLTMCWSHPAGSQVTTQSSSLATQNRFLAVADRFQADLGSLNRFYNVQQSEHRCNRMLRFYASWHSGLESYLASNNKRPPTAESQTAERLSDRIAKDEALLRHDRRFAKQLKQQHPFTQTIIALVEARQRIEPLNPRRTALEISKLTTEISAAAAAWKTDPSQHDLTPQATLKALQDLKSHLAEWYRFSDGYNPMFSWWIKRPYEECVREFDGLLAQLKRSESKATNGGKNRPSESESQNSLGDDETNGRLPVQPIDIQSLMSPAGLVLPPLIAEYSGIRHKNRPKSPDSSKKPAGDRDKQMKKWSQWKSRLSKIDFESLQRSDQVDYLLLKNDIDYKLAKLALPQRDIEIKWTLPEDPRSMSGFPIGGEALQVELDHEMIRYSPEQLVSIAEKELQWCRKELIKASNEMGLGNDWRAAIEKVKGMHVDPGQQPAMIKGLALEAIDYLKENDRLTIPPLATETWRMTMMSPKRQLVNPFFLGGEVIQVSYPTDTMKHRDKLESMRGNNIPFARATVHHELIPGHHLQIFSAHRNKHYREPFRTPFWMEGWALYWEMMLYDAGFPKTPEARIGFLVWRSHRCARIVFSLNFHLKKMTPPECVDLLVDWVGFDRNNAAAEVRRSVGRAYSPLYQAAYMLGGLQIRQLRKEVVDTGVMTEKQFHDTILQQNSIPISLLRAILTDAPLTKDQQFHWNFYGNVR